MRIVLQESFVEDTGLIVSEGHLLAHAERQDLSVIVGVFEHEEHIFNGLIQIIR